MANLYVIYVQSGKWDMVREARSEKEAREILHTERLKKDFVSGRVTLRGQTIVEHKIETAQPLKEGTLLSGIEITKTQ